ncbi:MAG: 3-oxoacyl-ACP synthase [Proteobacteria bacterium]|jgi:3-oxoacyl-[acyl-carrier-protein] synthase III|nr:3-oxoacyl-ACP synthase [Pseudomonadota bacterium]
MSRTRFESLGLYLPEQVVTTRELVEELSVPMYVDLETLTGIRSRRRRGPHDDNFTLALNAAKDCLRNSKYEASDLDVIINTSITRSKGFPNYYLEPAMSLWLKRELGVEQALNFDVANACAGMMTGVYIVDHMIKAGAVKTGMVVCGALLSPVCDTAVKDIESPLDEQLASLTLGDAGAAVIMDGSPNEVEGIDYVDLMTCALHSDLCLGFPSTKTPGISLFTQHNRLHHRQNMLLWPHLQQQIQQRRGVSFEDEHFDYVILHQIGTRFAEKAVSTVKDYFPDIEMTLLSCLDDCGNTAATSHFVVLYREIQKGRVKPGDRLLLIPSASGVVVGAMAVTVGDLEVAPWEQ